MKQHIGRFILLLAAITTSAYAQPFGFEWIRPNQPYFKIKILNEGAYRIPHNTLTGIAPNLNGIQTSRIQVFYLGIEQPLHIHGSQDGTFDAGDFIEFYATPNDGAFDSLLYRNPQDLPHPFRSYYSDTGVYFLTILPDTTVQSGLRYTNMFETNYGSFTPEAYHVFESRIFRRDEYFEGINLTPNTEKYNTSEYTQGEGWGAARIGLGQTAIYPIATPLLAPSGPAPRIEVKIAGVSDFYLTNPVVNHHVVSSVAPAENPVYTVIDDRTYRGYVTQQFNVQLNPASIGNINTLLRLQVINDLNVGADFNTLFYAFIRYPRLYDFSQSTSQRIQVAHMQPGIRTYLQIANYGNGVQNTPILYDFRNRKRVRGTATSSIANILMDKHTQPADVFVFDSTAAIIITQLEPITLSIPNPQLNTQFLLITHPNLNDAATQYQAYRLQQYSVLKLMVNELYDVYAYGIPHPMAIRRLAQHLYTTQTVKPQFMLLLGKGHQTNLLNNSINIERNLVPAIGVPAADNMFAHRITNNGFESQIPVGRIAARNNQEAINYLNKLKDYETPSSDLQLWRKNVLHISGGTNANEQVLFRNQINNNGNNLRGPSFGANVSTFNKSTNDPVQTNLRDELQGIINNGISMLTFLGHGSATVLDVNFGSLAETNNKDKYPLFYFNGCNIGNPSELDPIAQTDLYGPDYIAAPDKGVIGWLAHSNLTLDGRLFGQMNAFYNSFNTIFYGEGIARIVTEACKVLSSTDELMRSHCTQLTLQGDPAVRIFSPQLPDYTIRQQDVFFNPSNPNTSLDSFAVGVIVNNAGRANFDSIMVVGRHTLPNGSSFGFDTLYIQNLFFRDTILFWVKNLGNTAIGINTFEFTVNPLLSPNESNGANNTVSVQRFLPGTGVTALLPQQYAIVNTDTVMLRAQNNNILIRDVEYEFELDTTPNFQSPAKKTQLLRANAMCNWNIQLTGLDSTVYFWRVKINNVQGAENIWSTSSFMLIRNDAGGWGQKHFHQIAQAGSKQNIVIDTINRQLQFTEDSRFVNIRIARWWHGGLGIQDPYFATPGAFNCIPSGGMVAIVYDRTSLQQKEFAGIPMNCIIPPDIKYYAIDTKTPAGQATFVQIVDSMKQGDYMALYSYYHVGADSWQAPMRNALAQLGSQKVANASSFYTAMVLLGRKGALPNEILEDTIFNNTFNAQTTADTAIIQAAGNLLGRWHTGTLVSKPIGPAKEWKKLHYNFKSIENQGTDRNHVMVYAVRKDMTDSLVLARPLSGASLEQIDAANYPFIRLEVTFVDSTYRSPNQFGYWMAQYTPAPEGALNLDINPLFHAEKLMTGDSIKLRYAFENIASSSLDSLPYSISLTDANRIERYRFDSKLPPLQNGEHTFIQHQIATRQLSGVYNLNLQVNEQNQPRELTLMNNFLSHQITIEGDATNPIMDVTFDGYKIVNGDYVSPSPLIAITSKDDNPFKLMDDTATFSIFLRSPQSSVFQPVHHMGGAVNFFPATDKQNKARIEYKPTKLEDGLYTLRVQSRDASGNASGANMYEIDFRVENRSTITHFFPYPNPGTTNIRFVFTLTGSSPPDEMIVRIMTINGKIVREIRRDEFGPIKIGQNISQFAWDGTDMYGDRLANGVYLYRVYTRIAGETIDRKQTQSDKYFMHDTGKIYLLR
jgi:hypothetical protein